MNICLFRRDDPIPLYSVVAWQWKQTLDNIKLFNVHKWDSNFPASRNLWLDGTCCCPIQRVRQFYPYIYDERVTNSHSDCHPYCQNNVWGNESSVRSSRYRALCLMHTNRVWNFYFKLPPGDEAQCKACGIILRISSGTTTPSVTQLRRHPGKYKP